MVTSVTSTGSNLDVDKIVNALMKEHQAKIKTVDDQKKSYQVKLSNVGKIKSSIETMQDTVTSLDTSTTSGLSVEKIKTTLKEFVAEYNSTRTLTRESSDTTIKAFNQKLRSSIDPSIAASLGLSFDKSGQAVFNEAKFDSLSNDENALRNSVTSLFDNSLMPGSSFDSVLRPNGVLDYSESMLQKKVNQLEKKEDQMQQKLQVYEQNYRRQFNALDIYLNQLNANQLNINKINLTA